MVCVYICDDTPIMLEKYGSLIKEVAKDNNLIVTVREYNDPKRLMADVAMHPEDADIIYLDIIMEPLSGIETARFLRAMGYKGRIIYLTTSDEYVFDALDTNPTHYIVKGECGRKKFETIFMETVNGLDMVDDDYLICERGSVIKKILLSTINYLEVRQRIVIVHYDNETFEFYATMEKIEKKLKDKGFLRISRSYMANIRYIDQIKKSDVILSTGETIPLGNTYEKNVKRKLSEYLTNQVR